MGSTEPNGDRSAAGYGASAIGRMTQILDAFGEDTELGQTDLVERTFLPKATIHRTVGLLVEFGWLQRLGDRYRLGTRLFEMGGRVATTSRLREAAIPYLEDLYEVTHEIVNLGVLDGTEVIYIEKIGSHRRIDTPACVGHRFPAHCTALGKVILSTAPADLIDRVVAEGLTRRTDKTIVSPELFRRELERIAVETIAIDDEEFAAGDDVLRGTDSRFRPCRRRGFGDRTASTHGSRCDAATSRTRGQWDRDVIPGSRHIAASRHPWGEPCEDGA